MNELHGSVQQLYSTTFAWEVEAINSDDKWTSSIIFCTKNYHNFCLHISSLDKKTQSRKLYLCAEVMGGSKTYDFVVVLKYTHKQEIFVKGNVKPEKIRQWFLYGLETIKTDNLLKITCTFFNRGSVGETVFGTDKIEFVEKRQEDSEKRKQEEATLTEQYKTMKSLDTLSKNLKEAFLSQEDCDIIVKVGEKEYGAHTVILRNRSTVFQRMLQHDMIEKNEAVIDIDDCDPDAFQDFLLYLYAGKLDNMRMEKVFELHYISDKYDVNELKLDCIDFILNNLDKDNIIDAITLATRHQEHKMLEHAITFLASNAKDVFLTTRWQIFVKEHPKQANELIIKAFDNAVKNGI